MCLLALGLIRSWMRTELRPKCRRWWQTWTSTSRRCSMWTATCTLGRTARTTRSGPAINGHFAHYFHWALELEATVGKDGIYQGKTKLSAVGSVMLIFSLYHQKKLCGRCGGANSSQFQAWNDRSQLIYLPGFFQHRLWRKSRSPGPAGCSCKGTDLNRNFDANWGSEYFSKSHFFAICWSYKLSVP